MNAPKSRSFDGAQDERFVMCHLQPNAECMTRSW